MPRTDRRVLLLSSVQTYRATPFLQAGQALGIQCLLAVDMDRELAASAKHGWGFPFADTTAACKEIRAVHDRAPIDAIIALDDTGTEVAALVSAQLRLPHNQPEAALAASNKYVMRQKMAAACMQVPKFTRVGTQDSITAAAQRIGYPLVLKPLDRNGSQGVMRVDSADDLEAKVSRLLRIIQTAPTMPRPDFLMESYVPGAEYAVEALLADEALHVLAIFDKPDPLEGPFFEESIYVTPSRLPPAWQDDVRAATARATQALGLGFGPVHAELRINDEGVWLIEVAGRSIGGLCSETLRFGTDESLESLILRHACGLPIPDLRPQGQAQGVMMMPIPQAGVLRGVTGLEKALSVDGITNIQVTAQEGYSLRPLPEGNSYLGFIFAECATPQQAEQALRQAYACLAFDLQPEFDLITS